MFSLIRLRSIVTSRWHVPAVESDVARSASEVAPTSVASSIAALRSVVGITHCLKVVSIIILLVVIVISPLNVWLMRWVFGTLSDVVTRFRASVAHVVWMQSSWA